MYKDIFSARLGLNESVALLRIEPLYGAARHLVDLLVDDQE
jgi:hypothetical protein